MFPHRSFVTCRYISKNWKIVVGNQQGRGVWFGPVYPNGTKDGVDQSCAKGCLFDIWKDPTEHVNLKDAEPKVWEAMVGKINKAGTTLYQTDYGEPGADKCMTRAQAAKYYVGHNTCIKGGPGYHPSLPSCDETKPRLYLGPLCFDTLPPNLPPALTALPALPASSFPFCDGAESDKCKVCPSSGTVKKVCVMNDYKSQVQCLDCTKEENHRDCVDSECIKPDPNPCGPGKTCQGCASGMVCVGYACLDCNAQQNYKACDAAGCDFRFLQFARVAELS